MLRRALLGITVAGLCLWVSLFAQGPPGVWLDVPFVRQQREGCGAASVAMVMQYWLKQQGRMTTPEAEATEIQRILYSRQAHGIYASELEQYLQQHGFRVFAFRGEWAGLRHHLEKGRPLIVALKPAAGSTPLHYVVVTGIDWQQELVMVNDPAVRKLLKHSRSSFERQWKATGNWTLLAVPQALGG